MTVEPHDAAEGDEEEEGQQQVHPNRTVGRDAPRREDDESGDDRPDVPAPDRAEHVALAHQLAAVKFDGSGNSEIRGQAARRRPPMELDYDVERSRDDQDGAGADHQAVKDEEVKGIAGDPEGGSRILTQIAAIDAFLEAPRPALDFF